MQQAIHPIEIDESAEIGDVFHRADNAVAHVHAFHEFLPFLATLLLDYLTPAENYIFAVVIELNDFKIVRVTNELLQVLWRNHVDLRGRQKCLNADVYH